MVSASTREGVNEFVEDFLEEHRVRHKIFNFKVKQNPEEWQQAVMSIVHGLENIQSSETLSPKPL